MTTIDDLLDELRTERDQLQSKLGQLEAAIGQAEQLANTLAGRIATTPAVKREQRKQGKTGKAHAAGARQDKAKPKFERYKSDQEDVLAAIKRLAPVSRLDLQAATPHLSPGRLTRALQSLKDQTKVKSIGQTSGTRYVLFGADSGDAASEPLTPLQDRIVTLLERYAPMLEADLANDMLEPVGKVSGALRVLHRYGLVVLENDGWRLTA